MMAQKIIEPPRVEKSLLAKGKSLNHKRSAATPVVDKIIRRSKANRRAIELLDEDQQEYFRRNAKAFLAARMKRSKKRD
jgi:hypothetical protein